MSNVVNFVVQPAKPAAVHAHRLPPTKGVDYASIELDDLMAIGAALGRQGAAAIARLLGGDVDQAAADAEEEASLDVTALSVALDIRFGEAGVGVTVTRDVRRQMLTWLLIGEAAEAHS